MTREADKRYSYLSLAMKAGAVQAGEFAAEQAIRGGEAFLAVLAEDASDNTKKKFLNKCNYYKVPCVLFGDKASLGHCIGKDNRSILVVTNESLAGALIEQTGRKVVDGED